MCRRLLWAWVLWRISRLDLHPRAAHPDRAGGLAIPCGTLAVFGALARKMLSDETGELPAEAGSGLADLGPRYENARLMRPVPVELQHMVALIMAPVLPFLTFPFRVMPAWEVVRTLARLLV